MVLESAAAGLCGGDVELDVVTDAFRHCAENRGARWDGLVAETIETQIWIGVVGSVDRKPRPDSEFGDGYVAGTLAEVAAWMTRQENSWPMLFQYRTFLTNASATFQHLCGRAEEAGINLPSHADRAAWFVAKRPL